MDAGVQRNTGRSVVPLTLYSLRRFITRHLFFDWRRRPLDPLRHLGHVFNGDLKRQLEVIRPLAGRFWLFEWLFRLGCPEPGLRSVGNGWGRPDLLRTETVPIQQRASQQQPQYPNRQYHDPPSAFPRGRLDRSWLVLLQWHEQFLFCYVQRTITSQLYQSGSFCPYRSLSIRSTKS